MFVEGLFFCAYFWKTECRRVDRHEMIDPL